VDEDSVSAYWPEASVLVDVPAAAIVAPVTGSPPLFAVTTLPETVYVVVAVVNDPSQEEGAAGADLPWHAAIASAGASTIAIRLDLCARHEPMNARDVIW